MAQVTERFPARPSDRVRRAGSTPGVNEGPSSAATEDHEEELATRLRVAVTRLNRRLRQESLAGLSPAQSTALGAVSRMGAPTLGELAEVEQVQPPSMTRIVAAMERAGLVTREVDANDRRVARVRITAEGRRTLQRIRTLKNAYLVARLDRLGIDGSDGVSALVDLLERLGVEQ